MFDKTKLSCIVGSVEKEHPRTFAYYSNDDITVPGYFDPASDFRQGDKIVQVTLEISADSITRTEKLYALDFIGNEWKLFAMQTDASDVVFDSTGFGTLTGATLQDALGQADTAISDLKNAVSVLKTTITLAPVVGETKELLLDELEPLVTDGRPANKELGATVYGPDGSIGVISQVKDASVIVTTIVGVAVLQYKEMPTEDIPGRIVQYVGETTDDYVNGYFYKFAGGSDDTFTVSNAHDCNITNPKAVFQFLASLITMTDSARGYLPGDNIYFNMESFTTQYEINDLVFKSADGQNIPCTKKTGTAYQKTYLQELGIEFTGSSGADISAKITTVDGKPFADGGGKWEQINVQPSNDSVIGDIAAALDKINGETI